MKIPYQPFLLRFLHALQGISVILALITAFWTYDTYDGRWGKLPLPYYPDIEGIHGTFGLYSLLVFPFFILYSFHRGEKRLFQPQFITHLFGNKKPIFWMTIHRLVNTFSLIALALAVFSGKMMDEKWLPQGELDHLWYYVHLVSWVVLFIAILFHILMSIKVGGIPLVLSMIQVKYKSQDNPKLWKSHLQTWCKEFRFSQVIDWWKLTNSLKYLQVFLIGSVIFAWIIAIIKEA